MQFANLLRFDYWLDVAVVNQPAGPAMRWIVFAGVIVCAAAAALYGRRRLSRGAAVAWGIAGALVSLVAIGRLFAVPVLGLRIGWLIAAIIALAPIVRRAARDVGRDGLIRDCLDAMAFAPPAQPPRADWHLHTAALWLGVHLIGLAVIFANINLPIIGAPLLMLLILAPVLISFVIRRSSFVARHLSCLTPLTITYLTASLNLSGQRIEGVLNGVLYTPLSLIVMSAYAFAISCRFSVMGSGKVEAGSQRLASSDWRFVKGGAVALVIATLAWSAWTALTLRTHGVTGSDPYAYAQMGVDLATRGTVFHPFPLVGTTFDLGISTFPVIHVGYKIPSNADRTATTVWPPGYAVFTAAAFLAGGETGLYLITPLLNLISLGAAAWFAATVLRTTQCAVTNNLRNASHATQATRYAIVALTVFFTATSHQQVEWQMIPMADIAAQLFSILALTLAMRAHGSPLIAALSGLALGIAFDIRYTQVLMAPAVALALLRAASDKRRGTVLRLAPCVFVCALAALVAALPVLVYHTLAFGSPFHTGSDELTNFSLTRLPETLLRTLGEMNHYREFRWLVPAIAIGVVTMWRRSRHAFTALALYFGVLFLFHVAYTYLRLRDILSLFPVLSLLAAMGTVELWRAVSRVSHSSIFNSQLLPLSRLLAITTICALSFLLVLRTMETLSLPVLRGFNSFGYLTSKQRQSFDAIRVMTPDDAVIGSTLNSGAIDLHARRLAFRPQTWQPDELIEFVDRLHAEGAPVFVLADGEELAATLQTLRRHYAVREVGRVDVPYYFEGSGSENRRVPLLRIEPRSSPAQLTGARRT